MRVGFLLLGLCGASVGLRADFNKDIAPILDEHCSVCHTAAKAAGKLDKKFVVPGKPAASPLYVRASLPSDKPGAMPPLGPKLSEAQLAVLKRWIEDGASWPESSKLDEREEVRRIHDRIAAHASKPGPYKVTLANTTISYSMAPIPAGDFLMGSPDSDPQKKPDEQPQHKVHVDGFWMQTHEVTWDEYRLFMFANQAGEVAHKDETVNGVSRPTRPYAEMSFGMGINGFPAISMTQHAANKYAEWLSAKTGEFYRLPTEAEWEYACRADAKPAEPLRDYAWSAVNSSGKYQQVASKKPNAWGLYDMLGNVMEWTLDQYEPYHAKAENNPWVKSKQPYPHAVRGGSWNDPPDMLRCTVRVASDASWKQQDPQLPKSIWYQTDAQWLGFRLVRPVKVPSAAEMFASWNNGVEHDEQ